MQGLSGRTVYSTICTVPAFLLYSKVEEFIKISPSISTSLRTGQDSPSWWQLLAEVNIIYTQNHTSPSSVLNALFSSRPTKQALPPLVPLVHGTLQGKAGTLYRLFLNESLQSQLCSSACPDETLCRWRTLSIFSTTDCQDQLIPEMLHKQRDFSINFTNIRV